MIQSRRNFSLIQVGNKDDRRDKARERGGDSGGAMAVVKLQRPSGRDEIFFYG